MYIKIILIIISGIIILSLLTLYMGIHPTKFKTGTTPDKLGLKYENISFTTSDNLLIKGWFIPSKNKTDKTIIITHGYPFDKNNIIGGTSFLAEKFNLLLFDFRYFGESEGSYTTIGFKEKKDFLAAVDWLKKKQYKKIGAIGFSLGASVILMANSDDIKAIVADSPYSSIDKMIERTYLIFPSITKKPFVWLTKLFTSLIGISTKNISPKNEIPNINIPILLIHGDKDSQIPVENSKILYEASNKDTTELWIVKNADHGHAHSLYPKEYEERIFNFFEKNLK